MRRRQGHPGYSSGRRYRVQNEERGAIEEDAGSGMFDLMQRLSSMNDRK